MPLCFRIGDNAVELPDLKRGFVASVLDAHHEASWLLPSLFHSSVQQGELELHFSPANAVSLVPMNLSLMDCPVPKAHSCDSLSFPPAACSIPSPQSSQLSDRPPERDGLDGADRANDLEVHCPKLACRLHGRASRAVAERMPAERPAATDRRLVTRSTPDRSSRLLGAAGDAIRAFPEASPRMFAATSRYG